MSKPQLKMTSKVLAVICALSASFILVAEASEDDSRCKCVCPSPTVVNGTETNKTVYKLTKISADKCKCEYMVELVPELHSVIEKVNEFCPRCECKFESRSPTTIKVVVIIIICIMSFLLIYMLFLLCLDPLMTKRGVAYRPQTNEEVNLEEPERVMRRVRADTVLNRVENQKERWKSQVQEQRRNVYDRHAMLN